MVWNCKPDDGGGDDDDEEEEECDDDSGSDDGDDNDDDEEEYDDDNGDVEDEMVICIPSGVELQASVFIPVQIIPGQINLTFVRNCP